MISAILVVWMHNYAIECFAEQVTRDILKDFLAKYGKMQDKEKEKKRLGMVNKEAAIAIVNDYELPLTPEQFTLEIMPMYHGL